MSSLARLLDGCPRPTGLLVVDDTGLASASADLPEGVTRLAPREDHDAPRGALVVAARDADALRRAVAVPDDQARQGRARTVAVHLAEAPGPVVPELRPEWPEPLEVDAHTTADGGAVIRLRFATPASVAEVLGEVGRAAGTTALGHGGLVVARAATAEDKVPADVVLGAPLETPHPVTGRVAVTSPDEAVDEGVFNPIGFRRRWRREVVPLTHGPVTPGVVADLRDALAVRVPADLGRRDATALALAGLLAVTGDAPAEWSDPLRREEESVRRRRTALASGSELAWRARTAAAHDLRVATVPAVSILLATRRADMLPFALRQVAKQAPAELVLAAHGFTPDPGVVREHAGDRPVVVVTPDADTMFGDVLQAATEAASGDVVLKMDDDDWYGPDVVTDLVWARRYSAATLVGMAAELVYLEPLGLTVRRNGPSENYGSVVAGGTIMIGRDDLRAVGGWRPVARSVDSQLLAAVRRAGGTVYRTHGLGYLLRRGTAGHTWDIDLGYFLRSGSVAAQWRGFRPSRLLTYDEAERPPAPTGAGAASGAGVGRAASGAGAGRGEGGA